MRNFRVPGSYPEPDRSLTGVWDFLFRVSVRGSVVPVQGSVLCVISWFQVLSGTGQEPSRTRSRGFRVLSRDVSGSTSGVGAGIGPGLCVIPGFNGLAWAWSGLSLPWGLGVSFSVRQP